MSAALAGLTPDQEQRLLKTALHILLKGQIYNTMRITSISLPASGAGVSGNALQLIKNPLPERLNMIIYNAGSGIVTLTDSANNTAGLPIPSLGNASDKWGPGVNWYIFTASTSSVVVVEFA